MLRATRKRLCKVLNPHGLDSNQELPIMRRAWEVREMAEIPMLMRISAVDDRC
jgi:hypothetical protein